MGYQGRPNTITWILIRERKKQESQSEKEMGLPWWSSDYDCASDAGVVGSIPGQGTKIPRAVWCRQK